MEKLMNLMQQQFDPESLSYFLFSGTTSNKTYNENDEKINILMKSGELKNISEIDNSLINSLSSGSIDKHFICCLPSIKVLDLIKEHPLI
jgi:hypothetical protein